MTARPLSNDAWRILNALRERGWKASAFDLAQIGLNYRARISDLRLLHGVEIVPDPPHPPPGSCSLYVVPAHARRRAAFLWEHKSLAGFVPEPCQSTIV